MNEANGGRGRDRDGGSGRPGGARGGGDRRGESRGGGPSRGGGSPANRRRFDDEGRETGTGRIRYGGRARSTSPAHRSAARPSERSRTGDRSRTVAFDALLAIDEGAYANLDLPGRIREARLSRQDAAFVTELVYGTSRMRGLYDAVIAIAADRDTGSIDPPVLAALRLGAHQLLGMRVPSHAAVDETVALARERVGAGAAGFVNAVMRRVSERSAAQWQEQVAAAESDPIAKAAAVHSHPQWVVRALRAALIGHGAATLESADAILEDLLRADNEPAAVSLVARPGLADVEELLEHGASPGSVSPYAAVLTDGGDPGRIPAVRQGRAAVQDEGSQVLPAALVAVPLEPVDGTDKDSATRSESARAGERWLDMCAGPGGKAALLAALAVERDAAVFLNEVSPHRADLVEKAIRAAERAGAEVYLGVGDGRTIGEEDPGGFDRVLLDAPCTGLGALRRRPESRWRRRPDDVADLAVLQSELLDSAIAATRPGGVVAYVTCSPHLAETVQVVEAALTRHSHVSTLAAAPWVRGADGKPLPDTGHSPYVQLWPHVHGTDAMFCALLRVGHPVADGTG